MSVRALGLSREAQVSEDGTQTRKRTFEVKTDGRGTGEGEVLAAAGIPEVGGHHPDDQSLRVTGKSCKAKDENLKLWDVEVSYSDQVDQDDPEGDNNQDPTEEPASLRISFEAVEVAPPGTISDTGSMADDHVFDGVQQDFKGPFLTSADEPFDPPPMLTEYRPVVTIGQNEADFVLARWLPLLGAVNSDGYQGAEPRTLLFRSISADLRREQGRRYWFVEWEFCYRETRWDIVLLDAGTYYKDAGKRKAFLTEEGTPYIGLLDGAGGKWESGENISYRVFRPQKEKQFGGEFAFRLQ